MSTVGIIATPTRRTSRARLARMDWILVAAGLALSVLGVVLVWSATWSIDGGSAGRRQFLSLLVGIGLALLLLLAEPRALRAWAWPAYGVAILGLLATFSPLGIAVSGARAWLTIPGGFTLQPSEFAKLALILMAASTLAGARARGEDARPKDVLVTVAAAAPMLLIVLAQRDTGTALVMTAILITLVVVAGAPLRVLAGLAVAGGVVLAAVLGLGLLAQYQIDRLTAFLDPHADPLGVGHNTVQAQIAVGNGGMLGRGLMQGEQTQGGFVPVRESDFIFTVAAEELGFLGGAVVIGLLACIIWRGMRIALDARDLFGRCLAIGVVAWFGFQGFENIGMALGLVPVTGVTLPFVSYGGTSMMAAWLGIGLLQLVRLSGGRLR